MDGRKLLFDTNGNDKQKQVCKYWIDATSTDIVYGGSKGSGKSYLGAALIFGDAFMYPETHYFIARKQLNDLRKFTIPTIHEVFNSWGITDGYYSYNGQDNYYQLHNKSRIYLLDGKYIPSDPLYMRFGSMQMTRGMIEEAGEFEEDAKNNLSASIGRWKNGVYKLTGKLLQTCNPSKNYLYREYYLKHKNGELESWKKFVQAFPEDNKMLPDGYLQNLYRTLTPNQKERLLYGNWEYDDDPTVLCDYDAICDVFNNEHVKGTGQKYISADLAMQGRDSFVCGVWDGMVCDLSAGIDQAKATGKSIETDLKNLIITHSVPRSQVVADSDGLGSYLVSYLSGIKEFHGGSSAVNKVEYANIKSECAYKLAELINDRKIRIKCNSEQKQRIINELGQLKADNIDNDEGKKRIIKKDEMKERLGHSPDYLDMLIMRMIFEVQTFKIKAYAR
jgi:hypothetical protein